MIRFWDLLWFISIIQSNSCKKLISSKYWNNMKKDLLKNQNKFSRATYNSLRCPKMDKQRWAPIKPIRTLASNLNINEDLLSNSCCSPNEVKIILVATTINLDNEITPDQFILLQAIWNHRLLKQLWRKAHKVDHLPQALKVAHSEILRTEVQVTILPNIVILMLAALTMEKRLT